MRLRLLGPLLVDGGVNGLSPRDRAVLTALAIRRGEPVDTDTLAQVLWGPDAPASRVKVIQGCVVRLRRTLGPDTIVTTSHGYRLAVAADEVDSHRFSSLVERARTLIEAADHDRAAHALAQALTLWRGRPFVDVQEWDPARIEAERLIGLKREAEELAVAADLGLGRVVDAVTAAAALVSEAPLRERRWELLARAQYAAGRQVEALRTLQQARAFLAGEAGLEPGPGLLAVEDSILAQDPALSVADVAPEASTVCPYLGLVPYGAEDADVFFGRDRDVEACLRHLALNGTLAVVGPSGSGKSSLVRAGVVSSLERQGRTCRIITPGLSPTRSLEGAPAAESGVVLVVDQFEELVTLGSTEEARDAFLDAVVAHAELAPVVVVLRADVIGALTAHRRFARFLEKGMYLLGPMGPSELRAAIVQPAESAGLVLEPGLVELLAREVEGEPNALPLLSHSLRQTWEVREGRTLTVDGYLRTGGIRGAVAQTAERVFNALDGGNQAVLRNVMLRMVSLGPEGEPVMAGVSRRALPRDDRHHAVLEALIHHRLLTSTGDAVGVSHEALVRAWPRLRSWLDEDVEGARILRHLTVAADTWESMGRPDSELYRGRRLMAALDWHDWFHPELGDTENEFLQESRRLWEDERRESEEQSRRQARTNRQLRLLLGGAVVLLVAALVSGYLFLREANKAAASATTAEARRLSAQAQVAVDPDLSLLMAVEAVRMSASVDTHSSLVRAISRSPELVATARTLDLGMGVAATTTGLVVVNDLHTGVQFHEADTLDPVDVPGWGGVEGRGVKELAVRPGTGELVVLTSFFSVTGFPQVDQSPSLVILDPVTMGRSTLQLGGIPEQALAYHPSFSADGRYLAVLFTLFEQNGSDAMYETARVWDLDAPDAPIFSLDAEWIDDATLTADGTGLYLVMHPGMLSFFDVRSGDLSWSIEPPDAWGLEASPDGRFLATVTGNGVLVVDARVLEADGTVELVGEFTGFAFECQVFGFSHDGRLLAAGDGTEIRVWDVGSGALLRQFTGPERAQSLAFSRDDSTLYVLGAGGLLTAHDLEGDRSFVPRRDGIDWRSPLLAWAAPDGSRILFASQPDGDSAMRSDVADLVTGATLGVDPGHGRWGDASWSPDSGAFVTVGSDGYVRVWDAVTLETVVERQVSETHLAAVDWSVDGSVIMAASRDGTVRLLDAGDLRVLDSMHVEVDDALIWGFLSPDNRTVVLIGGPPDFVVVDVVAGAELHRVNFRAGVWIADFSPDGRVLMVGGGSEVGFFDLERGEWLGDPVAAHKDSVFVQFSPDGSRAVSGGWDGTVVLWDPATRTRLADLTIGSRLTVPMFHPDGHTVLIPYFDGSIFTWDIRPESWTEHACRVAGRDFTLGEWNTIVGEAPFRSTCREPGAAIDAAAPAP